MADNSFYWGFCSRTAMGEVLEEGRLHGWKRGLGLLAQARGSKIAESATPSARADWQFLVPLPEGARILDVGSGLGDLSFELAGRAAEVVAFDATLENLQFIEVRRQQEGIDNVKPVAGSVFSLPFADGYFDMVVLVGVLEWLGAADVDGTPIERQRRALRCIRRVLAPGGALYVAIENRYGAGYWLGKKDEHTNLRFVTLMPRRAADLYAKMMGRNGYEPWTYSPKKLTRLLQDADLPVRSLYFPCPDYRHAQIHIPMAATRLALFSVNSLLANHRKMGTLTRLGLNVALRSGLMRSFAPSIAAVAGACIGSDSLVSKVVRSLDWSRVPGNPGTPRSVEPLLSSGYDAKCFLFSGDSPRPSVVLRIARDAGSEWRIRNEYSLLEELRGAAGPDTFHDLKVPTPVGLVRVDGVLVSAVTVLPGRPEPLAGRWRRVAFFRKWLRSVADWLLTFQRATMRPRALDQEVLRERVLATLAEADLTALGVSDSQLNSAREMALELLGTTIPIGTAHADLWPGNILSERGALSGVVDWTFATPGMLPTRDWFAVVLQGLHKSGGALNFTARPDRGGLPATPRHVRLMDQLVDVATSVTARFLSAHGLPAYGALPLLLMHFAQWDPSRRDECMMQICRLFAARIAKQSGLPAGRARCLAGL